MHIKFIANNLSDTEQLGRTLAHNLRGGEVIELVGDLGAGKTTLVRSLVPVLGSEDEVASPSFTISRVYKSSKFTIHHFDFYRLPDAGIVGLELAELIGDPHTVVIIEWGETVHDVLPSDKLVIDIKAVSETWRQFDIICPDKRDYLIRGL